MPNGLKVGFVGMLPHIQQYGYAYSPIVLDVDPNSLVSWVISFVSFEWNELFSGGKPNNIWTRLSLGAFGFATVGRRVRVHTRCIS